MSKRVVVTGMGTINPLGHNTEEFWQGCVEKKVGIAPITLFDTTDFKAHLGAEVKEFEPKEYLDPKQARRMSRFSQFAVIAAREAFDNSGLDMEKEDAYRVGVSIGSGIGGLSDLEKEHTRLMEKGPARISPLFIPMMISNMAAGNVAITFGLKGKNIDIVTACASGTHSIGEAFRAIQYGEADVMLAGGAEAAITPVGLAGFASMQALSLSEDPMKASIPFDKDRHGFVMGEGAGIVVLEELEHAKKRGAHIYAEVLGYGATCDAFHITSPAEDGSGAAKAMEFAIQDAGIEPKDVDYINAHGTGTSLNDLFETRAIHLTFGEAAKKLKINSTKSMIGHLLGAAGGVEFITCVKSIENQYVHATVGLTEEDPECDLDYVKRDGIHMPVHYAMSNSLGFGGHNACMLLGEYAE